MSLWQWQKIQKLLSEKGILIAEAIGMTGLFLSADGFLAKKILFLGYIDVK